MRSSLFALPLCLVAAGAVLAQDVTDVELGRLSSADPASAATPAPAPVTEEAPAPAPRAAWKDDRVAEQAPNLYGQNGLVRVTSARPGKHGTFDLALRGRAFYLPDFIGPGADENAFGSGLGTFGVTLFDLVELGLAAHFAGNANSEGGAPAVTAGDLYPSLKLGLDLMPVAFGVDVRGSLPASLDGLGPDLANFGVSAAALFTLDLYETWDLPLRLHVNGGYAYQNARNSGAPQRYYLRGVQGHLLALTTSSWFYDQVFYGVGVELPFPYVTVYTEVWGQMALGIVDDAGPGGGPYGFLDSHLVATPGVRATLLPGLAVDVGADLGVFGTGGYFSPGVEKLTAGQPLNPAYAVHVALSWTFNPFERASSGGSRGEVAVAKAADVEGCVTNARAQTPIEGAHLDLGNGVVVVSGENGCFKAPALPLGKHTLTASHPDYKTATATVDVQAGGGRADVALVPTPRAAGLFRGMVTNARNQPIDGRVIVRGGVVGELAIEARAGVFEAELPAGRYHAVVEAPGHFKQGSDFGIEEGGRTVRSFNLKPEPRKRIARLVRDRVQLSTKVPFELGQPRLLPAAEFILDDVVDLLLDKPGIARLRIEGVPGNGDEAGDELAKARAEAVVDFLISRGVPSDRLEAGVGAGGKARRGDVQLIVVDGSGG